MYVGAHVHKYLCVYKCVCTEINDNAQAHASACKYATLCLYVANFFNIYVNVPLIACAYICKYVCICASAHYMMIHSWHVGCVNVFAHVARIINAAAVVVAVADSDAAAVIQHSI